MKGGRPRVSLYLPGLLDARLDPGSGAGRRLHALERLLAGARCYRVSHASDNALLCALFGYRPAAEEDIPMAAIGRLMDDALRPEGHWVRADPVHLHADQNSLILVDAGGLSLTQHDALALAAAVRQSFTERGWALEVPVPSRWYAKLDRKPAIRTSEIQSVAGRDISRFMPAGEDAAAWHRLMNEVQMQLHDTDINRLRQDRGELPVNSLWLWGSGALPDLLERRWSAVYSDDNHSMGLSMLSSTPCHPLPETAAELLGRGGGKAELLVVMSGFQSVVLPGEQREAQLLALEEYWSAPLLAALEAGKLRELRVLTRTRDFRINRFDLMKFWKSRKPFHAYTE